MYGRTGDKHPMFGKKRSDETIKRIAESNKGKKSSDKARKKMADAKPKKPVLQFSMEDVFIQEFESLMEASRNIKVHQANISEVCKGKRKSAGVIDGNTKINPLEGFL